MFTREQMIAIDALKSALTECEKQGVTIMFDPDYDTLSALDENDQYVGAVTCWGELPAADDGEDLFECEDPGEFFSQRTHEVGSCWKKPDEDFTIWVGDRCNDE